MYEKSEYEQWQDELNGSKSFRLSRMIGSASFVLSLLIFAAVLWNATNH